MEQLGGGSMRYNSESAPIATLCVFLVTGHTFTFKNVRIESDNESMITFTYRAMSDGCLKRATFSKIRHVAGISTTC